MATPPVPSLFSVVCPSSRKYQLAVVRQVIHNLNPMKGLSGYLPIEGPYYERITSDCIFDAQFAIGKKNKKSVQDLQHFHPWLNVSWILFAFTSCAS